jgi:peptidyl-prolyl cis-trans isomerase SurA
MLQFLKKQTRLKCSSIVLIFLVFWHFTATAQVLDKTVAIVNDEAITHSELLSAVNFIKKDLRSKNATIPQNLELQKQVLNHLILENLQLQLAKQNHILATEEEVKETLRNMAHQNKLSLPEFEKRLKIQGYDYPQFVKHIQKQMTLYQVQQAALSNTLKFSEQEIQQVIAEMERQSPNNKYRISHILVALPESPSPALLQKTHSKISAIEEQLKNGASFGKTALEHSDAQDALNQGDLGWKSAQELPLLISERLSTLEKGAVVGPIQNESGFHWIKLSDVQQTEAIPTLMQWHVRHILLKISDARSEQEAQKQINALRAEILEKKNFESLALHYSDDTGSASKGGDLGWITPTEVVPPFATTMVRTKPGDISLPFMTVYGVHILEVIEKRSINQTRTAQREEAMRILQTRKFGDAVEQWVANLRAEAHVQTMLS